MRWQYYSRQMFNAMISFGAAKSLNIVSYLSLFQVHVRASLWQDKYSANHLAMCATLCVRRSCAAPSRLPALFGLELPHVWTMPFFPRLAVAHQKTQKSIHFTTTDLGKSPVGIAV